MPDQGEFQHPANPPVPAIKLQKALGVLFSTLAALVQWKGLNEQGMEHFSFGTFVSQSLWLVLA